MPSTCTPLSPRALKRSRYGGDALGRPSRASSCPRCDRPMALSARACCAGGAAAKAPTQRAARRNRRRMWCLGLRLDAQGGGGGGGGYRSYLCSTPSSCDGVECVFAFPAGGDAPSGASVHAGSMPPAHVLCRLRAMDAHKQQHGSGSGRRTLTPMIESVAARGGRENYSFDCGGDCLSHHVVLMPRGTRIVLVTTIR